MQFSIFPLFCNLGIRVCLEHNATLCSHTKYSSLAFQQASLPCSVATFLKLFRGCLSISRSVYLLGDGVLSLICVEEICQGCAGDVITNIVLKPLPGIGDSVECRLINIEAPEIKQKVRV